ncbi:hypothetical protein BVER_02888c [Candidatus Burkholderia verschuerenii]|uniref:Uncharacterized protein n=1 Tax=Candidatus Burkholderia verschuerenii TaxID=242163 RepID=A0A0L0MFP0_9BURK|nr:hypothetical protein [Candidatus Burkholderia verschuerenii]KND61138.1 hypothetical protein BVER_02888c [Candidatus Burkholderia verschuerenii]
MKNLRSTAYVCAISWTSALDALITHLVTIVLILGEQYWLSSLTFSVDAGLRVFTAPALARKIADRSESFRSRLSALFKCAFVLLAGFTILLSSGSTRTGQAILGMFIVAKIIFVLDGLFGAHLLFKLESEHKVDIATSSAALNLLSRGATAVASALPLAIVRSTTFAVWIAAIALTLQLAVMWYAKALFFDASPDDHVPQTQPPSPENRSDGLLSNPFTRWGLLYALLGNFLLAGVTLLLMRMLTTHDAPFVNEISALYLTFFLTQIAVLIYGNRAVPATTIQGSCLWLCVIGALTITVAVTDGNLRLIMCMMLGSAYGFLLSAISKTLLPSIGKTRYVFYSAWVQPIGRGASVAATLIIGAAMAGRFDTALLLTACETSALAAAMVLYLTAPDNRSARQM